MTDNQNVNTGTPVQSQEPVAPVTLNPTQEGAVVNTPTPITEIELDGLGKVKIDDIKEWKQGYMRQSDYTKKTQTIAQQRKEAEQALELYNFLKANPVIAQQIADGKPVNTANTPLNNLNPALQEVDDVRRELSNMKLDMELERLKSKYKDFDEVEVINKAAELGIEDLEFVYKGMKADTEDNLKETLKKQIEAELLQKIQQNNSATQTIIAPTNVPAVDNNYGLTDAENALCEKAGWDKEAYAKNKQR